MAIRRAEARNPLMSGRVFRFIRDMLLLESAGVARRGGPGRAAAVRGQVPAGHGPGHGQGGRGHGLLRLQPAGVAQRGRRRPGAVRRPSGGGPRVQPGPAGPLALCAVAPVHARHQAQRGRPRPDQRPVRDPRGMGAPRVERWSRLNERLRQDRRGPDDPRRQRGIPALPDARRRLALGAVFGRRNTRNS